MIQQIALNHKCFSSVKSQDPHSISGCCQCNLDGWKLSGLGVFCPCLSFALLVMATPDLRRVCLLSHPETNHRAHPLVRENSGSIVLEHGFVDNVLHNMTPRAKGGKDWEAGGYRLAGFCGLVSQSRMTTTGQLWSHIHAVSLPWSLGSSTACAALSCRNAH